MGILYVAGFEVGADASMTATVGGAGKTVASGHYMCGNLATGTAQPGPWVGTEYTEFTIAVQAAFGAGYSVVWDSTTGKFTVSHASPFTMSFATAADLRLRAALGFTGNKSGQNSYTSDALPLYIMESVISGRTNVVGPIEADDIAEESISDGGDDFVVTKKTDELLMSWEQQMEPRSALFRTLASDTNRVWADWFRHVRGSHPFWCSDPLEGEEDGAFFRLTAEGASFKPQRVTADYDDHWIVPFRTRWLGEGSS